jgi:hypothetical protein
MANFSDLVARMDKIILSTFDSDYPVTIHPFSSITSDYTLPNPDPIPLRGGTATYNGIDYDIRRVDADLQGGYSLFLERRSEGWDK